MKTAVNLFLWTDFVQEEHFKHFNELKRSGYDGVEIPLLVGDATHYKNVAKAIKGEGLECPKQHEQSLEITHELRYQENTVVFNNNKCYP